MESWVAKTLALIAVLVTGTSLAFGEGEARDKKADQTDQPKGRKTTRGKATAQNLADWLAEARKNNPDIRVAEAKVSEAEAELHRALLQVMQRVVALHNLIESQRGKITDREAALERMIKLQKKGFAAEPDLNRARQELVLAKTKLAELEGELAFMLGKQPLKSDEDRAKERLLLYVQRRELAARDAKDKDVESYTAKRQLAALRAQSVHGSLAERLRKALDAPVTLRFDDNTALGDALEFLESKVSGVSFRIIGNDLRTTAVGLRLKEAMPLGAALQAIEDTIPELRFAVRDYGILVTVKDQLPPNALSVQDFWKSKPAKEKAEDATGMKNPPPQDVQGKITLISPDWDLVKIDLGSDAGLSKGHTLEVFRLQPKPVYLGTVQVLATTSTTAIARPLRGAKKDLRAGDLVASRIKAR